ncbi:MAG: hypothetical protein R3228_05700 [Halioglobus sp.]|nr:hypothetical protein [Halioglobus sp.]
MCNRKEKRVIHNLNRLAIAGASFVAMLIDGVNTANCLYLGSALAWLFLPECDAVEEQLFDRLRRARQRVQRSCHGVLAPAFLHSPSQRRGVRKFQNTTKVSS